MKSMPAHQAPPPVTPGVAVLSSLLAGVLLVAGVVLLDATGRRRG